MATSTSTWCGPGWGTGRSTTRMSPGPNNTAARMESGIGRVVAEAVCTSAVMSLLMLLWRDAGGRCGSAPARVPALDTQRVDGVDYGARIDELVVDGRLLLEDAEFTHAVH